MSCKMQGEHNKYEEFVVRALAKSGQRVGSKNLKEAAKKVAKVVEDSQPKKSGEKREVACARA